MAVSSKPIRLSRALAVAAIAGAIAAPFALAQAPAEEGRAVYVGTCAGCHSEGGEGGYGPPLVSNGNVGDETAFVDRILNGGELMPALRHLPDEDIAMIVNFVRMVFNDFDNPIDAAFVAGRR